MGWVASAACGVFAGGAVVDVASDAICAARAASGESAGSSRVLLVGLAGNLPGGRVGVGFHRVALGADGGPARGAVEQAAQGLADVRQFVRDEHITGAGTRPVLAFGEVDVGAVGNRPGLLLQRP